MLDDLIKKKKKNFMIIINREILFVLIIST